VSGKSSSSRKDSITRGTAICGPLVFLAAIFFAASASSQTTRPFDDEPLASGTPAIHQAGASGAVIPASANVLDVGRVGLALLVVLVAIFLLRWLARQFVRVGLPEGKPIKVLSRSVLSPKQQLLLLQIGKRLVVVGDSGGSMNPLCEISDPDEVATLVGQANENRPITKSFGKIFKRAKEPFDEATLSPPRAEPDDEEMTPNPEIAEMSRDIGGLMEKVESMRKQFKRT
jgi:flagellar biogenesis protein FliO